MRHHLHDLGIDALPHFRAAMVDQHGAIHVHVHEGAGLVQMRDVEGDAEFQGRECQALLQNGAGLVVGVDGEAPRAVIAALFQFRDEFMDHVVDDFLAIRRDIASFHIVAAIEIEQADIERIALQMAGDFIDHVLDGDGALRPAEAPESRVRLRIRLAAGGADIHVGQVICVVKVADGARGDGAGQVRRVAGARGHVDPGGKDPPVVVVAHFVFIIKTVALARHQHVVVAVGAQFDGALQFGRRNRCGRRPQGRLRFLAAKTATHAPAFDGNVVRMHAQRMCHHVLHLARMLGRTQHQHALRFLRDGVGNLSFQVKLFLAAHIQLALDHMRRRIERGLVVAARQLHRRQHIRLCRLGRLRRHDRGQFLVRHLRQAGGTARMVMRIGHHDEDRLAHVLHQLRSQDGIVMDDGTAIIGAGNVLRRVDSDDPLRAAHGRQVHGRDARMRLLRQAQCRVQSTLQFGDIVRVRRLPQHMQLRRFMGAGLAHGGPGGRLQFGRDRMVHAGPFRRGKRRR